MAIEAVKPTATPPLPDGPLTRELTEVMFLLDARAIASCNVDKAALFEAGWPK